MSLRFKRILLKLSGEALMGQKSYGIDGAFLQQIAGEVAEVHKMGVQISIVIGGGNIFRGVAGVNEGMDRVQADHMGMLATCINGLALQSALELNGIHTRLMSAIELNQMAEPYIRRRAIRHLEKNRIVIFSAGTGNPYFTTDTAAALRAVETEAEVIIKATKVDGVYSSDPMKDPEATRFDRLTYMEVLEKRLAVMDTTAVTLSMDNNLPIVVFNLFQEGNLKRLVSGETIGTLVQ